MFNEVPSPSVDRKDKGRWKKWNWGPLGGRNRHEGPTAGHSRGRDPRNTGVGAGSGEVAQSVPIRWGPNTSTITKL